MLLKTIKATKSPERVNLIFSGDFYLPLAVEDIYTLGLTRNQEITPKLLDQIIFSSLFFLTYSYALRQIAMSPKNETVLKRKINQYLPRTIYKYGLTDYQIDREHLSSAVLAKISKSGLINEREFALSYLRRRSRKSRRQLQFELQSQGVSPEMVRELMSPENNSDINKIKNFLDRKSVTRASLSDQKFKNRILAALARRGFSYDDIMTVIDDLDK